MDPNCAHHCELSNTNIRHLINMETSIAAVTNGFYKFLARFSGEFFSILEMMIAQKCRNSMREMSRGFHWNAHRFVSSTQLDDSSDLNVAQNFVIATCADSTDFKRDFVVIVVVCWVVWVNTSKCVRKRSNWNSVKHTKEAQIRND